MDTKIIKIVTHASTFFAPIIVPLLVMLLASERALKSLALQALLFHIAMTILIAVSWLFSFLLIGIPFLIVFSLMAIYYPIKGIIYAATERRFHYPLMGSL
jgi:hypothetical protein